jgi:hypothetical protein
MYQLPGPKVPGCVCLGAGHVAEVEHVPAGQVQVDQLTSR